METNLIDQILRKNSVTKKYYVGCRPSNFIPVCQRHPCSMVVNLEPSGRPGSHWVAIFAPKSTHVYYFDSLGLSPPRGAISVYLRTFKKITTNNQMIQPISSDHCGHYAISFIYFCSLGYSFESVMQMFHSNSESDILVQQIVRLLANG